MQRVSRSYIPTNKGGVSFLNGIALLVGFALLVGVALAASGAAAQPAPVAPIAADFKAPDAGALSPAELRSLTDSYVEGIKATRASLGTLHEKAKNQKDVVKTLCLDDKVGQVKTALDTATDRRGSLREALENGGTERAKHEFTLIAVLTERVGALTDEANQCIGEDATFSEDEESTLDLEVTSVLPSVDGDTVQVPPPFVIAPAGNSPIE
jgi:hypothetical protein